MRRDDSSTSRRRSISSNWSPWRASRTLGPRTVLPAHHSSQQNPGDDLAGAFRDVQNLRSGAKETIGYGYSIEWRHVNSRRRGGAIASPRETISRRARSISGSSVDRRNDVVVGGGGGGGGAIIPNRATKAADHPCQASTCRRHPPRHPCRQQGRQGRATSSNFSQSHC